MKRRGKVFLAAICLAVGGIVANLAFPAEAKFEREVLFPNLTVKILGYVDWPFSADVEVPTKLKIGVYDKTPGREYYREFRKLRRQYDTFDLVSLAGGDENLDGVHVIYIAGDGTNVPEELKNAYIGRSILVVRESEYFGEAGSIIRFQASEDNKAQYGINLKRAKESRLAVRVLLQRKAVELVR